MKSALTVVLFRLFTVGVFVDGKEASHVLVIEGDSVILKSGVTDVQKNDIIEWRFNGNSIDKSVDSLQLDSQTGDLKISNIRTTDSGLYKVKTSSTRGSSEMEFNVKVVSADEETSVSVMEGDSVTLRTDPTYIQGSDVIRWRFGQQKSLVAEINRTAGIFNTYDGPDERFRDRLQLDHQTGSLTITDITTEHTGLYEAEISSTRRRYTTHHTQSFSVTGRDEVESVSVLMGDSVTLRTGLTKTQIIEQILWKFEDNDKPIPDLIDLQTGDLTIRNIQRDQCGYYKVEINTTTMILHRKYQITMIGVFVGGKESNGELVSVTERDSVTLMSGVTEIQADDEIEWEFNGSRLATISIDSGKLSEWFKPDGPFRNRLQLDKQTGDLKISDIKTTDSGLYIPTISSPRGSPPKMTFTVNVVSADEVKLVSVVEGYSVTLRPDPTYIQGSDVIRWRFGQQKSLVAEINRTAGIFNTYDGPDERFRDRLTLDHQTGSLIIMNITDTRSEHAGLYEAEISSTRSRYTIHYTQSFSVTVSGEMKSVSVKEGGSVTLQINVTKIQSDDLIYWMFGNFNLAKFNKKEQQFYTSDGPDERFRCRLKLDNQTGSLNITDTRTKDSGDYQLKIISSRHIINRKITVTVSGVSGDEDEVMSVMKGNRVTLNTGVTNNPGDVFLWYFEDTLIALVSGHPNTSCLYYGVGEIFKDRLDVDYATGSLIITTSRPEHTGRYEAEFIEGKPGKTKTFNTIPKCDHTKINPKRSDLVIHKSFILIVSGSGVQSGSGLSPGAVAGIVVAVAVAVGAAAAGFVCYRRNNSVL